MSRRSSLCEEDDEEDEEGGCPCPLVRRRIAGGGTEGELTSDEGAVSRGELTTRGSSLPPCHREVVPIPHIPRSGDAWCGNGEGEYCGEGMETSVGGGGGVAQAKSGGGRGRFCNALRDSVCVLRDRLPSGSLRRCVGACAPVGLQDDRISMADAVVRRRGLVCLRSALSDKSVSMAICPMACSFA